MLKNIIQYLVVLVIFFAVDLVWLGVVAKGLYAKYLGYLMAEKVNWAAALFFYMIFILGLLVFIVQPALAHENMTTLILSAALFGLVTYSTYDLTNLATLKDWPIVITLIDLVWGTSLSVLVSVLSVWILKLL